MSPFQKETSEIIAILDEAHQKLNNITNPEIYWLKSKIQMDLARHANALKMQLGQDIDVTGAKEEPTPLTRMFGKDIVVKPRVVKDVNKPFLESSFEVEAKELKLKVDEFYPKFLITESDQLIDSLSDIEIRGVAKKAGLPVTETEPKTITTGFVDEIKEAIHKQLAPNPNPEGAGNETDPLKTMDTRTEEEKALDELRATIDTLYNEFDSIDNKSIVDTYSDIEIRGVAKKAGLPVTETEPAKISYKYIDQIKSAIKKQAEIQNLGK